ncbi:hypothetical protein [Lysinibacillus sp. RC79]|uniref:hypothetical protein n=1 Tax=Lysinibacillus sp. RC79 TaxID=3156296 RepID=UPI003515A383
MNDFLFERLQFEQERAEKYWEKSLVLSEAIGHLEAYAESEHNVVSDEVKAFATKLLKRIEDGLAAVEDKFPEQK